QTHRQSAEVRPGVIPPAAGEWLSEALQVLGGPPVVIWGNGSHTRSLIPLVGDGPSAIRCIVDKSAREQSRSPEGARVIPARDFAPAPNALIVLSSQLYEAEMWADLTSIRSDGGQVLALYRRDLVTDQLRQALRMRQARRRSTSQPTSATATGRRLIIAEP